MKQDMREQILDNDTFICETYAKLIIYLLEMQLKSLWNCSVFPKCIPQRTYLRSVNYTLLATR